MPAPDTSNPCRRAAAALLVGALAAAAAASAQAASTGGSYSSPPPRIGALECRTGCQALDVARAGSLVRVTGAHLAGAVGVAFLGSTKRGDETTARPKVLSPTVLEVRVPAGTRTGRVAVGVADGRVATSGTLLGIGTGEGAAQGGPVDAQVAGRRVYVGGRTGARLSYVVRAPAPTPVRVDVVRKSDTTVVASWAQPAVVPGAPQQVEWRGVEAGGGAADEGRYEFRVATGELARASSAAGEPPRPGAAPAGDFLLLGHRFPIAGPHDYGTAVNRFGAPRGGRSHMGHDLLANCGVPLVAARGGIVSFRGYQAAGAGNYLVIDGERTSQDYVYMHLRDPALPRRGERVFTGERIGYVGTTGSSTACHLHFEIWEGPWWDGGRAIDPLAALREWDRHS